MKLKIAIVFAVFATAALLYLGAFTCKPGDTGLRIGGVILVRGC